MLSSGHRWEDVKGYSYQQILIFAEEAARERMVDRASRYQDLAVASAYDANIKKQHWRDLTKGLR